MESLPDVGLKLTAGMRSIHAGDLPFDCRGGRRQAVRQQCELRDGQCSKLLAM